jgi:GNAT superfamily N-acetyltransferase
MEAVSFRLAEACDLAALRELIDRSVRELSLYTPAQIEGAIHSVLGVDSQLIADGTYFAAEIDGMLVASGGWSFRRTLCGADGAPQRDENRLDPAHDYAKIRAIFVHPEWARRGLGSSMLAHCEAAAAAAGFSRFEMGSTLAGVPLYSLKGYVEGSRFGIPLANGESLPVVRMTKEAAVGEVESAHG